MKEVFLSLLVVFTLLLNVTSINANKVMNDNESDDGSVAIEPRWWPGNSNPEPGSEAWLQQHMNYSAGTSWGIPYLWCILGL